MNTPVPWLDHPQANTHVIAEVVAWEVLDSRAHPTVACSVALRDGSRGKALVPTGASTGQFETPEIRDGGTAWAGLGVQSAVAAIDRIGLALQGQSVADAEQSLEGASNVTLAISLSMLKAVANARHEAVWQTLATDGRASLPCPMVNIFSGGRHAEGGGRIQDFLAIALEATSFRDAVQTVWEVRRAAAHLVEERHGTLLSRLVADEGGLAVLGENDDQPLQLLAEAIRKVGKPMGIAIDVAATQIDADDHLVDAVCDWIDRYPIVSIEDPLGDDNWQAWSELTRRLHATQVVGDDLFATNLDRLNHGVEMGAANAVLIKPNQIGSLTGAWQTLARAKEVGYATIASARSGDTEDDVLADLAVGWDAGQIKIGSLMRSERLAKYNRLLEIEARHGLSYRGWGQE